MAFARVVIIGCGMSGMTALNVLSRYRQEVSLTVIDKSVDTHFLPLLPDCVGRNILPGNLTYPIKVIAGRSGAEFVNQAVVAVDIGRRMVTTGQRTIPYDYLVIASGSETNFYGNEEIRSNAYKLDDAYDAAVIRRALDERDFEAHVIGGAGYTGVEIATNLRRYLNKRSLKRRIIMVERAPSLLAPLPDWMKSYAAVNLAGMGIETAVNSTIASAARDEIVLSNGEKIRRAQLIWAAGVRTADFIQKLDARKNAQGRVEVDPNLRLDERCFIAGDAALFTHTGAPLRMSVMFAIEEGATAAANVIRSLRAGRLVPFRPFDPGYIIPMANNVSCGIVMGMDVKGRAATMAHYAMCLYRSCGMKNRIGVLRNLSQGGRHG